MDSFAVQTKKKLFIKPIKAHCCRRAFLMGFLSVLLIKKENDFQIAIPFAEMTSSIKKMIREQCGRECIQGTNERLKKDTLSFDAFAQMNAFQAATLSKTLDPLLPKQCASCRKIFLRGVFLACGRLIPPQQGYFLELDCRERIELIDQILKDEGVEFRHGKRRNREYLYTKRSALIEDFFSLIGDQELSFSIMNEKITREFRNNANRVASCESNNIAKTVTAAGRQIDLIERLQKADKLSLLPKDLHDTALLRLANREASLEHLAHISTPPLTKSGLNHRLQKIKEMAEQLLEEKRQS